jgi:hypothetical protein
VSEATTATTCLEAAVADTDRATCVACCQQAQQTALGELRADLTSGNVGISCETTDSVVCQPLESCTCFRSRIDDLVGLFDFQPVVTFEQGNITAFVSCEIPCDGTT